MPDSTRWDSEDSEDSEDLPVPSQPTASENLEYIRLRMAGVPRAKARARAVQLVKQEQGSHASKRKAVDEGSSESRPASKKARNNARISTIDLTAIEDIESDQDGSDNNTIKPKSRSIVSIRKRSSSSSDPVNPFDICLKGDDDGSVPIYDSCDEIRRKIKRYLRSHGAPTKAAFLRDIAQAGYPDQGIKLQSKQLTDFLTKDGATSGSTSRIFYAAYVYFEKLRLAAYASEQKHKGVKLEDVDFEKAPKNEHRKRMEAQWKRQGGFPREYHQYVRIRDDQVAYEDELGKLIITRRF